MSGSFLDTTIVVHLAEGPKEHKEKGEVFVAAHQPAEAPYYALRELLAGRLRLLCEAHNTLLASDNHGEALVALLNRSPAEGRKKEARILEISKALKTAFANNPHGNRNELKREILQDIALKAVTVWRNANHLKNVNLVQSLACFNHGKVTYGADGELQGPSNSFNCLKNERCSAAGYIYDNKSVLNKMIEALHPKNLDEKARNKNENKQRRKALKELSSDGPIKFNKQKCRALGDAYFAAMSPGGYVIATTNLEDHEPLCSSIGKIVKEP